MNNPLLTLQENQLPPFQHIKPEHVEPAIDQLLAEARTRVEEVLAANTIYTWDNLMQPLEDMDDRINRAWSPVGHMSSVVDTPELRTAYNNCLPKLSEYGTEMGQHEGLFRAIKSIADSDEFKQLHLAQQKTIENALRDFRLTGIDLDDTDKNRFKEIMQQRTKITNKFDENLLDATNAWKKHITDEAQLAGLPDSARALAKQTAAREEKDGWMFSLEFPSYYAIITYADERALRHEIYEAYATRASDQGPHAGKWDNTELMESILRLRHEAALLLGFNNYAERSIATKMADTPQQVIDFLHDLAQRSKPVAEQEYAELEHFAHQQGCEQLEAWDIAYYSEKLQQHKYSISQEDLKPYFPEDRVLQGMFGVVNRLYGVSIKEKTGIEIWHPDVRFFEIHDDNGQLRGQFYLDLYARPHKRGGAWMDECISRKKVEGGIQTPVAYLTCNLSPPVGNDPALFTHDEVVTIFHEFGHGLHHMLTMVDYPSVSGISGVAWDAVELPSQFMENWCWEREALDLFAAHYQSGEKLPDDLYKNMYAAKNFLSGMQMARQLEFALFDFRMHLEYDAAKGGRIYDILNDVRNQVSVVKPPAFNRFAHGFSHIFSGGYAAGYYSYKWAEVLSSDAFAMFEEQGIFHTETGAQFLKAVLEQGGSRDAMELFIEFRGREPQIDALLRHSGIAA